MTFTDFSEQAQGVTLLQRSFANAADWSCLSLFRRGPGITRIAFARALAKTLNCQQPQKLSVAVDCCDACPCRKIDGERTATRYPLGAPESKSRIVSVDQMRELMREIQLKPNEAEYKVAVIVAADRLNPQAANAFLKTLEEPPPETVLILLTTEPGRF